MSERNRWSILVLTFLLNGGLYHRMSFLGLFFRRPFSTGGSKISRIFKVTIVVYTFSIKLLMSKATHETALSRCNI